MSMYTVFKHFIGVVVLKMKTVSYGDSGSREVRVKVE